MQCTPTVCYWAWIRQFSVSSEAPTELLLGSETSATLTLNWANSFSTSFSLLSVDPFNPPKYPFYPSFYFDLLWCFFFFSFCNLVFFGDLQDFDKVWPIFDSAQSRDFRKVKFYFSYWGIGIFLVFVFWGFEI